LVVRRVTSRCRSPKGRLGSGITDPGLGTRAAGIRPTTRPRAPRGPRTNDDEHRPLANGQPAKQAGSAVPARSLDSPHRVPTAPHVATVAMNPATSRSLEAFAACGHTAPAHTAIDPAGCGGAGSIAPNLQGWAALPEFDILGSAEVPSLPDLSPSFRSTSGWM
jgi:hypothetical protein